MRQVETQKCIEYSPLSPNYSCGGCGHGPGSKPYTKPNSSVNAAGPGAFSDDPYGVYRIGRTLEDICLEAPHLRPNQDGVHLGGYCEDGVIRTIPASLEIYLFPQNQG